MNGKLISTFVLLFLIQTALTSCPKCNQDFYDELMSDRGNTLGGQELLQAIRNQQVAGQPSSFVLPAAYNNLTDIRQSNNQDSINTNTSNVSDNGQLSSHTTFYSVIITIAQFIFPGF